MTEPHLAIRMAYFSRSQLWYVGFNRVIISVKEENQIVDWLKDNAAGWWDLKTDSSVAFEDEHDANLFYLAFV